MKSSLDITFGIEMECVFYQMTVPPQFVDQLRAIGADMSLTLRQRHESIFLWSLVLVLREAGFSVNDPGAATDYSKWTVGVDGSVQPDPDSDLPLPSITWKGVEIKTPVFLWRDQATAFQQVNDLLLEVDKFQIWVNPSCGLHVHVGNGERGFPLRTLKTFAQFVTMFEKQLESLHPHYRINNVHCRPPRSNFQFNEGAAEYLKRIENCTTIQSLVDTMSCEPAGDKRGFAYNLTNLATEGGIQTIVSNYCNASVCDHDAANATLVGVPPT